MDKKIHVFINAFYSSGKGMSGGDKRIIEILKRWCGVHINSEDIIIYGPGKIFTALDDEEVKEYQRVITSTSKSEQKNVIFAYFIHTFLCKKRLKRIISHIDSSEQNIIYTSSSFLPDVLPAVYSRKKFKNCTWCGLVHHVLDPSKKREGNNIRNGIAFLEQRLALKLMKRYCDKVLTVSPIIKKYLEKLGFNASKIYVVNNGVDALAISRSEKYEDNERQYDGIFVARLAPSKGIHELADIWNDVVGKVPDARLAVIGSGDESTFQSLKKEFEEYNISKNVDFLGYCKSDIVYSYLKSSKVFVFPSHEESWGIAVAEALACGVPAVTYDLDAYKFFFNGLTIESKIGDFKGLAISIVDLLTDTNKRDYLANVGRNYVLDNYTWEQISQKEWELINAE